VFGQCEIGDRTQIGDHVQIPSGRRQHARDSEDRIQGSDPGSFGVVVIGEDCWIGSSAIVMENVGPRSTVGAGSVVTRPVPADTVVAGNPARVIRSS
jgi:acetyltransferase-like isoleucine patch superfamily enzyme